MAVCFKEILRCQWNMCAHNRKMQGWINPQKDCGIAQNLYILILNMETRKITMC